MIHYHGADVNPNDVGARFFANRHALISFAYPAQLEMISDVCSTFVLDNGAFTHWRHGGKVDVLAYKEWVKEWSIHPAFDWCLIPDVIEGSEKDNDQMLAEWDLPKEMSVPVWHYNESIERARNLSQFYHRIALGSCGEYKPGVGDWWGRTKEVFEVLVPGTRVHGLRMLNPKITSRVPLSSADSSSVARHLGNPEWLGVKYTPASKLGRAQVLADRIEHSHSPRYFTYDDDRSMNLFDIM